MEQSTSNTSRNPLSAFFMEDEIEVSQILLDLHKLIDVSEPPKRGCKRKRSSNGEGQSTSHEAASSSPKSVMNIEQKRPKIIWRFTKLPICFSSSESDENNCSNKRTKTEYKFEIITTQEGYKCPDLNIPSEDTFREDDINKVVADRRAKCAEARRIRRELIHAKLMRKFAIRHA
ncbi:uncharacterized protein LOC111374471 [Olea europaea var. sylvestris]|uniref:Uncharacterized protein LOC111374471 n=1 Tax=Olea europaea subsp. europaea TaxID=158383 RepID=A0A8S0S1L4_OLEEU|nr:uncharacterized protein LOC111374471 [Olea europaea var. sylvestris]CAA2985558.1 uncharacterized protein LOC111374471 [Olea europaea subsp. europaea]